jgi:tetratricopeptide (TPR) repeat protein
MSASNGRIFLSYSRSDAPLAETWVRLLKEAGHEVLIDRADIAAGEDWRKRLVDLIAGADTIVVLLGPRSAVSEVCIWEAEESARQGKRILPLLIEPLGTAIAAPVLAARHWIDGSRPNGDGAAAALLQAIRTDLSWVREHARLAALAGSWDSGGRRGADVLRAQRLAAAERWLAERPSTGEAPTALHQAYIAESRRLAGRRLRFALGAAIGVAALAGSLAVWSEVNRREAVAQRAAANESRRVAEAQRDRAESNLALARRAVDGLAMDVVQGLRDQEGMSSAVVRRILGTVERTIDGIEVANQSDPDIQRRRALLLHQKSDLLQRAADLAAARDAAESSLALSRKLALQRPDDPSFQRDLGVALHQLAALRLKEGSVAEAIALFREGVSHDEGARLRWPDSAQTRRDLIASRLGLAGALKAAGELAAAADSLSEARRLLLDLHTLEPGDADDARQGTLILNDLADIHWRQGRRDLARAGYLTALAAMRRFAAQDSLDTAARSRLAIALSRLADADMAAGRLTEARAQLAESLGLLRALIAADRDNGEWLDLAAGILGRLGNLERRKGDIAAMAASFDEALDFARRLPGASNAAEQAARLLLVALGNAGDARRLERKPREAQKLYLEAFTLALSRAQRNPDIPAIADLAKMLTRRAEAARDIGETSVAISLALQSDGLRRELMKQHPEDVEVRRLFNGGLASLHDFASTAQERRQRLMELRAALRDLRAITTLEDDEESLLASIEKSLSAATPR